MESVGLEAGLNQQKTYVVRNIQNIEKWIELGTNDPQVSNPYRFVGSVPVKEVKDKEQEQPLYRIYWGESPNSKTYQKKTSTPSLPTKSFPKTTWVTINPSIALKTRIA